MVLPPLSAHRQAPALHVSRRWAARSNEITWITRIEAHQFYQRCCSFLSPAGPALHTTGPGACTPAVAGRVSRLEQFVPVADIHGVRGAYVRERLQDLESVLVITDAKMPRTITRRILHRFLRRDTAIGRTPGVVHGT